MQSRLAFDTLFDDLVPASAVPKLLHGDGSFTEGPVWFADAQCLIWSDIPNNRMLRWTPDGAVSVFRKPSNFANGNTRDRRGRLVTCEHGMRRVTRTEPDGTITVLVDRFQAKKLNSPNDVVVKSDGTVWFTDPDYGLRQNLPGEQRFQAHDNVFRFDPAANSLSVVCDDFDKPNGLAFSPDEKTLYVADSAVSDGPGRNSHIRAFDVGDDGRLSGGAVFVETDGIPDGLRLDTNGRVWTSAGAGVNIYAPDASLIGRVAFPADVTNLTFGGANKDQLFVTAGSSLYLLPVLATGAQWP